MRLWCVLLAFAFTACSTIKPRHNSERGLFDRMAKLKPAGRKKRGKRLKREDFAIVSRKQLRKIKGLTSTWQHPLKTIKVTSAFGERGDRFHEGVDLMARSGTPVFSVQKGTVIYAGSKIGGYGRMVVVKHQGGLFSVYAHNRRNLVKKGAKVSQGQRIAYSGSSGRASGPHLHFEVRSGVIAVDPQRVLF